MARAAACLAWLTARRAASSSRIAVARVRRRIAEGFETAGGWSSADGRRRIVIGGWSSATSRGDRPASERTRRRATSASMRARHSVRLAATRMARREASRGRERRGLDRRRLVALVVVLVRLRSLVARLVVDTSTLLQGVGGEAKSHDVRSVVDEARGALDGDADASRASGCADGGLDEGGVRGARVETPSGSVGGPTGERTALRPVRENHGVPGRRHQIPRRARISRRALYALRSSRPRPNLSTITPARARVDGSPPTPLGDVESRARRSAFHPSRVVSPENFEKFPNDDSSSTERK